MIADLAARPRRGAPLAYGLAAFVIARETQQEAEDEYHRLLALAARTRPPSRSRRHARIPTW